MISTSNPTVLLMDIKRWTAAQVRGVASKLNQALYDKTPKDTGHAASNWVASSKRDETIYGTKQSINHGAYEAGLAWLQGADLTNTPIIYINNSVPYIGRLNDGWSAQAPAGFIEAAVADAEAAIEWPYAG